MIQKTSLEAYYIIEPELGLKQEAVYKKLKVYPDSSNHDISRILGIPINCVTPRMKELRDMGIVVCNGSKKDTSTHRRVMIWKVVNSV